MKILVAEKLSQHRYKTPEGYLICVDSVLARTGKQTYRRNEIFADSEDDRLIEVDRKAEEVFSPETMASFENKPICVEHPDVDVTVDNISEFAVGFVRDIHKGEYEGEPVMLGTLVITDAKTIEEIENGEHTDLSCGYDCDIEDCDSPEQKHIRGNHIALCEHGRAGIAHIVDSVQRKNDEESTYTEVTKNLEKEADKDMKWLDTVVGEKKEEIKDESNDFLNTPEHRRLIYEFMENNGNSFIISKEKNRLLKYIEKETGIKNADWHDVMYIIKNHTRAKLFDEEIKDYVPFPKKDALNKSNGLEEIKRIINNKDNTFEDTEGMIYLTEKAYNDIKVVIKIYGITQKELEGISKYFFGPGGYNMFR